MVENTNSTTSEVQGSFALTYMVGFIPLNLRSQEMDKGVNQTQLFKDWIGSSLHVLI